MPNACREKFSFSLEKTNPPGKETGEDLEDADMSMLKAQERLLEVAGDETPAMVAIPHRHIASNKNCRNMYDRCDLIFDLKVVGILDIRRQSQWSMFPYGQHCHNGDVLLPHGWQRDM